MITYFIIFNTILISITAIHIIEKPSIYGTKGINVWCNTVEKFEYCQTLQYDEGIDILKLTNDFTKPAEFLVSTDQLANFVKNLAKKQIQYEIVVDDISDVVVEELEELKNHRKKRRALEDDILNDYPLYDEIVEYLKNLANDHSDIMLYFSIGKSYEKRDIPAVKISSGDNNKPSVIIEGGIHAREWISPTTALYAIKELVTNPSNKYIFDNVDIYVVPLINPDGYEYSHLDVDSRLWRKTRSVQRNTPCLGVDANRNFQTQWMLIGASSNPCSVIYAGPSFFSEPETVALRNFVLARENVKVYLTLHSYGNYFLYPWAHTFRKARNEKDLSCTAERAIEALRKVRGSTYKTGSASLVLYPSSGSSQDWAMEKGNAELAFTMELPSTAFRFAPPLSEIIPIGQETFEAIKVLAMYADHQICTN